MDEQSCNLQPMASNSIDSVVYARIRYILANARVSAYAAVNSAMVEAYWDVGRHIEEAVGGRAEYGSNLMQFLSQSLTAEFGKEFTVANLRNMRQFYRLFPNRCALRSELPWTHYRALMRLDDDKRREFYLRECIDSGWTARQLERQINSFFYERLLATQKSGKAIVKDEIFKLEPNIDPAYVPKDPYILEFLNLKENKNYVESEFEQGLIDHLQEFLLEFGKGFFCGAAKTHCHRGWRAFLYRSCFL